jgi:uncharacterized protein with HEPN domain
MEVDVFVASRRTIYAVTRAMEIISEVSRRLPDEFKARYPALDWTAIAAVGNLYRHEYENVDDALVWHTAKHNRYLGFGKLLKYVNLNYARSSGSRSRILIST